MAIAVVPDVELPDRWPWPTEGGVLWEDAPERQDQPQAGRRHLRLVDDRRGVPVVGQVPIPLDSTVAPSHATPRRRTSARVRRRRLMVASVISVGVLVMTLPIGTLLGHAHAPTLAVAQPGEAGTLAIDVHAGQGTFYVVQPGDTLQSIATRIAPSDPGLVVRELSRQLGSDQVVAGEHISLP